MSLGDNDSDIDFSIIRDFFTKDRLKVLLLFLMVLIPVILTLYIRLMPADLPATEIMAKNAVENYYKNGIGQQISSQYPNLPPAQQQKLINDQYAEFTKSNQASIDQQVIQTADYFKTGFQYTENNNTYTFLGDLDSYYYLRQARNIIEKGSICDEIIDGKCIDNHMKAPLSIETSASMHPYGIAYLYKFLHLINPKINLMHAAFLLPTVIAVIITIVTFFLARRLMNDVAGFFAAVIVSVHPLFLSRSLGSDTDIWIIALSLIVMYFFFEAFYAKTTTKKIIFSSITGLMFGIFAFTWGGWWYIFDFILAGIVLDIGFLTIKGYIKHKNVKHTLKSLNHEIIIAISVIISSAVFVMLFTTPINFFSTLTAPFYFSNTLDVAASEGLFGNVLTTVAELNDASIQTIISQLTFGIQMFFVLSLMGIVFTLVNKNPKFKDYNIILISTIFYIIMIGSKSLLINSTTYFMLLLLPIVIIMIVNLLDKESTTDIKFALIIAIWFFGMMYASIKGVRFILLIIPAFSLTLGISLGYIYNYICNITISNLKMKEIYTRSIVFIMIALLLINPVKAGISTGESFMPSISKGWWDTLTQIREKSAPDAIINSWWDFGHWFKYVADRRVTFDGASQLPPLGHWMGKLLQTDNVKETHGLLRMINCGSNNAFDEINKKYQDTEISENIINEIVLMDKVQAEKHLKTLGFKEDEIQNILKNSHCTPPEAYLITSGDMVGKAGVWSHFGLWNIDKAYIVTNLKDKSLNEAVITMKERWNYSEEEATKIYYEIQTLETDRQMNDWISPWPGYGTGSMIGCNNISEVVICNIGMGIGGNGQQNYVIERTAVNISNPMMSQAIIGVYDATTGMKVGESNGNWNTVLIASDEIKKYNSKNGTIGMALLININENAEGKKSYNALVADPLLIDSTFTKLYYLDGKYTENYFEKFSDITDMTGTRIIVWKVK